MKKILIVNDKSLVREELLELFWQSNYQVIITSSGNEVEQLALKHSPDLILYDNIRPEFNEYSVSHHIQPNSIIKQRYFIFKKSNAENSKVSVEGIANKMLHHSNASDLLHSIECSLDNSPVDNDGQTEKMQSFLEITETNPKRALKNFVEGRRVQWFNRNQTIFYEGNHPKNIFYIQKGKVKVYKMNEDGKELIVRLCGENEFFGYVSILENTTYKVSAKAIERCEIAIIPRSDFDSMINTNALVLKKFIQMLAGEVGDYEQMLLGMAYNSLRKKVAETLLRLTAKFEQQNPEQNCLKVSRPTLAALAGTATESLIRTLSDFKKEKLIDITDGNIKILDSLKLTWLAN